MCADKPFQRIKCRGNHFKQGFVLKHGGFSCKNIDHRSSTDDPRRFCQTQQWVITIDPDAPELVAAFESRGQMLRVRIQDPKKSDRGKLSELLMQLVS
jgi:hypothetical protein